jgi:hypothetical protein
MGKDCKSEACQTHKLLGEGDSSTLEVSTPCNISLPSPYSTSKLTNPQTSSTPFNITYGSGTVTGTLATDTLHLSSLSPQLTFGLATTASSEFLAYPMDGILGIGRGEPSSIPAPIIMDVLTTSNLIPAKLYGVHLSRSADSLSDGEFNLGAPNTARYDGGLNYISINGENARGFWEIPVEDAGVDSGGAGIGVQGRTALIDTGTSFMYIPEGDATAIHALLPSYTKSGENYLIPCSSTQTIWMQFGGRKYNISAADYVGPSTDTQGECRSNIIGRQTFDEGQWLLGDAFLKNVYTVFDFEGARVGFGVKGGDGGDEARPSQTGTASGTPTATVLQSPTGGQTGGGVSDTASEPSAEPARGGIAYVGSSPWSLGLSLFLSTCVLGF